MRILKLSLVFTLLINVSVNAQNLCKEVVGYFPNWQWYDRNKVVNPQTIQYEKYNILNYAFFSPQSDGHIIATDEWADDNLLLGTPIWYPVETNDFTTSVVYLAHEANVKIVPSIGGWTLSNNFPSIAADPVKRAVFVNDCMQLIDEYQFDGIDIDWEYPGFAEHNGTAADKTNFTILMQDIRDALGSLEISNGKSYILSACFSGDPLKMENIEYGNLIDILDMFNMMTYDFSGTFDAVANHNSPLYAPAQGDPNWNLDAVFHNLTDVYGVPANKINLGVAFYGRTMTNCAGLFQTHSATGNTELFAVDEGTPLYYNIVQHLDEFTYNWDDLAKVPYLTNGPDLTFVTYDNEASIREKGEYIAENNGRGAIIWEITGDYIETYPGSGIIESTPLVDALNEGLCSETSVTDVSVQNNDFKIYPNPAKQSTQIYLNTKFRDSYHFRVYNQVGELIYSEIIEIGLISWSLKNLEKGVYLIQLDNDKKVFQQKLIVQ
ncbi:MAG: T9SS type A sorting domain-containing protein [Bacteroidales bacterium]|nr:T9SS type A sorting domain-containing protein [Bacteroidales bacterium]